MTTVDYISEKLPYLEALAQLAEEAAELAHAALKMRRAMDGTNPTPTTITQAFHDMKQEFSDVWASALVLGFDDPDVMEEIKRMTEAKTVRWAENLKYNEEVAADE